MVCICTILLWILLGVALRLSLAFTITTCTLMAADWIADNWSAYPLKVVTDSNTTLLQGAVMARKSKKRFAISFATGLCILILWFVWLCYEFISSPVCADFFGLDTGLLFIISGGIGGIVGVIIAAHVLRKINNNLKSIDRQIQEYTSQLP